MSLKKDNNPHSPKRYSFGTYSIVTRLTIVYAFTLFAILTLTTCVLYYALTTTLHNKDKRFLIDKIIHFRSMIKSSQHNVYELEEEVKEGGGYQFHKYLVEILDANGSTMVTSEISDTMDELPFPHPYEIDEIPLKIKRFKSSSGEVFIMISAWADCPDCSDQKVLINTALNVTVEEAILKQHRKQIYIVLITGLFFAAFIGMLIAKRGLNPLQQIAAVIKRIRASQLHERLAPSQWPQELVVLATSFDEMLDRLEDSFVRLSRFSTDIAHELRTPLNNLMGETEVSLSKIRTIEEYQQILESNLEEYTRLSHMIEGLLFLARAENTDIKLDRIHFEPLIEIRGIIEYYEALAEEKNITVHCGGSGTVCADPLLFRRAVTNIISNAFRYSLSGSTINIAIQEAEDHSLSVSIQDNGIGIESEELENIFERFYRTSSAKDHDTRGSGLGLSIAKSIMDLHGGKIDIQSELGKGTIVTLRFPSGS